MPGKDGTGPLGKGPMKGQGAGRGAGTGRSGAGRGRMGGKGLGSEGECLCPQCGTRTPHARGIPCVEQVCPNCGTKMVRAT